MSTADRSVITIDYKENLLRPDTQRDGDRNERGREWERTEEAASQGLRWSGWGLAGGKGLKRDRQVHRGEREMRFTFLILFYQALGELGTKQEGKKDRRAVRGRERGTKGDERVFMQRRDQSCTLSTLFSNDVCYMTAACEHVTDLNSNSKKKNLI